MIYSCKYSSLLAFQVVIRGLWLLSSVVPPSPQLDLWIRQLKSRVWRAVWGMWQNWRNIPLPFLFHWPYTSWKGGWEMHCSCFSSWKKKLLSSSLPECGRHSYFLKLSLLSFPWYHSLGFYLPILTACFWSLPQLLFLLSLNVDITQHLSRLTSLLTTWFSLKDFINNHMFIFNVKPASGFISPHLDKWVSAQSLN